MRLLGAFEAAEQAVSYTVRVKNWRFPFVGLLVLCLVAAPAALAACPGGCSLLAACDHTQEATSPDAEAAPSSHHPEVSTAEAGNAPESAMPACHGAMEPDQNEPVAPKTSAPVSTAQLDAAGCCTSGEGTPASSLALRASAPTQLSDAGLPLLAASVTETLPPRSIRRPLRPPAPQGDPPGRLLVLHQAFLL